MDVSRVDEQEDLRRRIASVEQLLTTCAAERDAARAELVAARDREAASAEILRAIAAAPGEAESALQLIAETCARLCAAAGVSIQLAEGEAFTLEIRVGDAAQRIGSAPPRSEVRVGGRDLLGAAVAQNRQVHIPDLDDLDPTMADWPELPHARAAGARTLCGTPLRREGKTVGALIVCRDKMLPFTQDELSLQRTFADQAAIAIQNGRLIEAARGHAHDLEEAIAQQTATANVLKVISRSVFDLDTVLQTLIDTVVQLAHGSRGTIFLRQGDLLVARAFHSNVNPALRAFLSSTTWPLDGDSQMARAARERAVVHISDLSESALATDKEVQKRAAFGAGLWTPLMREGEVIGVFGVPRDEPVAFSAREIELVQTFADQAVIAIENSRLFEEVQAKTRDLTEALVHQTASGNILKVIASSPTTVAPALQAIVDSACEVCGAYDAAVNLLEGDRVRFSAHRGPIPIGLESWPLSRSWVGGRAIVDRVPVHVHDLQLAGEEFPDGRDFALRMGHRTILAVPLIHEGDSVGAIIVRRTEAEPFTEKQIELLRIFADQAVIAIGNVRLFEEVQARTRDVEEALARQTATAEVLKTISRTAFDLDVVLDTLVSSAGNLCAADGGIIWLRQGEKFHAGATYGLSSETTAFVKANPRGSNDKSIVPRVLRSGKTEHVQDRMRDPEFSFPGVDLPDTLLGVPMFRNGCVDGVFTMHRRRASPFTARQVELFETFADQAVIAIENARLFSEVQAKTRDLEEALAQQTATADVLKVISRSAFDLQTVLDTLVSSAATLCEAEKACIFLRRGEDYHWVSNYGFSQALVEYAATHPFRAGSGSATSRVALDRTTVHLPDVLADPNYQASEYQRLGDYRTMLAVPLLRDGDPVGVFIMTRREVRPFNTRQIELLQTFADQAVIAIENSRLLDEVQARTRDLEDSLAQQTATADVLKTISRSAFDLQAVLDTLIGSAVTMTGADSGLIYLQREAAFFVQAHYDPSSEPAFFEMLRRRPQGPGRGSVGGRVLLTGETQQVPDISLDPDYDPALRAATVSKALLGIALKRDGAVVGAVVLARRTPGPFGARQIELAETFADQAVIAVENARLLGEVQARTHDLEETLAQQTATADVLKVISRSAFDLQVVYDSLLKAAVDLLGANRGSVTVREGGKFVVKSALSSEPAFQSVIGRVVPPDRATLPGRVLLSGVTELIADTQNDPEFRGPSGFPARSGIGVPLLLNGRVEGALALAHSLPDAFEPRHIQLLETFADQAVIAIGNTRLFEELQSRTRDLEQSLADLHMTQDRLVQSEKLASLGQLTAGIAHEIKNPLNFVNNFASLSRELLEELRETLERLPDDARADADDLIGMIGSNLAKVAHHGKRADSIVKNMLLHSREGSGERSSVNVNAMLEEALNLGYHGARAEKPGFNVTVEKAFDPAAGEAELYLQEVTRVLLNLISNGFYATEKRLQAEGPGYEPTLTASTRDLGHSVEVRIRDNGVGIPDEVRAKMFNPFFTTKPAGEGTGLGLSLSHDIVVKQHGGTIDVETVPGHFTEFVVTLPRQGARA